MTNINKQIKKMLFSTMLKIRLIEEELASKYKEQEMRCPMHLCIGQEAIAAGVSIALNKYDSVFSGHRAHGHYIAKGGNLEEMIAELYGRINGCCGGRGGSMHLIDLKVNFMGSTPIVGGTVPLAVGTAWASKLRKDRQVTVVYFGDGCFEEGVIHESLNFAALHKLPILFICENNDLSVYSKLNLRQPKRPIYKIAQAHGVNSIKFNGNDPEMVYIKSINAINQLRKGKGPFFFELNTYRWREHCGPNYDDDLNYRSDKEISKGKKACPLINYQKKLIKNKIITMKDVDIFKQKYLQEINLAFSVAKKSKIATFKNAEKYQYA